MILRFPQFTVRRLMVSVAIAGVLVGGWVETGRRRDRFRGISAILKFEIHKAIGQDIDGVPTWYIGGGRMISDRRMSWRLEMIKKYEKAAERPWLPVAPDPPEPE